VVTALRQPSAPARVRWVPLGWRRLVLGACGVALTAGVTAPAVATPGPVRVDPPSAAVSRATPTALAAPTMAERTAPAIVVSPGDSLWRLAAERLDPAASDAAIDVTWHRLYDANRAVVGADPDHIEPGQRLTPPRGW
jgi:nucleoid-associated protein YgaU